MSSFGTHFLSYNPPHVKSLIPFRLAEMPNSWIQH